MPAFHSLKLLPTNCATNSTTQSPTASPVIRLHRRRRRKTLRMLLLDRRHQDPPEITDEEIRIRVRHKLKDLLVSSPPPTGDDERRREGERKEREALLPAVSVSGSVGFRFRTVAFRRGGAASLGPVSSAFRRRLLRRAWRPVLLTIPE
ncbi:uncharacterized protein LOC133318317 [Gastrolobium bilobum]|uniref:uncharacterized protein LOC133318317 n=1 Tax=Gastrolobium bilobum TaxID=150636 RepID=UPI002AB2AABC|nr:uncharacterized protein LOC133318317 [Gastrolobium bilobum]